MALPFNDVQAYQVDISLLDSLHTPALASDPTESAFPGQQEEVIEEWHRLLGALSAHLSNGGFEWSEPMRGFFRFYFREDGTIKRLIYNMRDLEAASAGQFSTLVDEFSQRYQFGLATGQPFAQCSPAALVPPQQE